MKLIASHQFQNIQFQKKEKKDKNVPKQKYNLG